MSQQPQDRYLIPCKTTEANMRVVTGAQKCIEGDHEGGLADFDGALQLDPDNVYANFNKAMVLIDWGHQQLTEGRIYLSRGLDCLAKIPDNKKEFLLKVLLDSR